MSQSAPTPRQSSTFKRAWLPLVILLLAIALTIMLVRSRKPPVKQPRSDRGILVEVIQPQPQDQRLLISATGTVQADRQLRLSPQISGQVIALHPQFRAGGSIERGERLLAIDPRDYQLAVTRAENSLSQASLKLQQVTSEAEIARREWHTLNPDLEAPPLADYQPQLEQAKAELAAATADLQQARINLQRTELRAPFNGRILSEHVDLGQNLQVGQELAQLISSDFVEVVVPIPLAELPWLGLGTHSAQRPAALSITTPRTTYHWTGQLDRTLGQVDELGRMVKVVIKVANPYSHQPDLPLQPGMFVDVSLHGVTMTNVTAIPRRALRDNATVWLYRPDNTLAMATVDVVRKQQNQVLIRGLAPGDRVITTAISGAAEGMKLRLKTPGEAL